PIETFPSLYEKAYPGGITSAWYSFVLHMAIPHTQVLEAEHRWGPEELRARIAARLAEPDIRTNSFFVREFNAPRRNAAFVDQLLHPTWDDFWDERSIRPKHARIRVPAFLGSFWGYYGLIDGAFEAFTDPALDAPKRLAILSYGTSGAKLPLRLYDEELLRWYDHWLKSIDTGVLSEPPLRLYIPGRNVVRDEREWPLARTDWTRLYLRRYGELDFEPESDPSEPDAFVHLPPQISVRMPSLVWQTAPFTSGVEVTGPVALTLFASIDAEDGNFVAGLYDVAPDGRRTVLTKGYLRASHRALDTARSTLSRPIHPHVDPEPVEPGAVVEYQLAFSVMCNWFAPGHRLALELSSTDSVVLPEGSGMGAVLEDKMNAMGILPGSRVVCYRIHRDSERRSHLLLPVIPEG
ncbi:MAG: CocE/NonD family hydrolase, partial [Chloroflexi bacterium]|nr:CocE/NonD family hydrolase [Chloroflexota bacterium]